MRIFTTTTFQWSNPLTRLRRELSQRASLNSRGIILVPDKKRLPCVKGGVIRVLTSMTEGLFKVAKPFVLTILPPFSFVESHLPLHKGGSLNRKIGCEMQPIFCYICYKLGIPYAAKCVFRQYRVRQNRFFVRTLKYFAAKAFFVRY